MADSFATGDTVMLKSGAPEMTVEKLGKDMENQTVIWCTWFVNNKRESGSFVPATLVKT